MYTVVAHVTVVSPVATVISGGKATLIIESLEIAPEGVILKE